MSHTPTRPDSMTYARLSLHHLLSRFVVSQVYQPSVFTLHSPLHPYSPLRFLVGCVMRKPLERQNGFWLRFALRAYRSCNPWCSLKKNEESSSLTDKSSSITGKHKRIEKNHTFSPVARNKRVPKFSQGLNGILPSCPCKKYEDMPVCLYVPSTKEKCLKRIWSLFQNCRN